MRIAALLSLTALVAAGCGGSDGATTSGVGATATSTPAGPSAAAPCARIRLSAVQRLVDQADPQPAPRLRRSASGTSRLLQCHFNARGVKVGVALDRAQNNRQRFDNRITEMSQFSTTRPSTLPRPVPGVGDAASGNEGAQWIPALDQLLAYRPGQYLIVDFTAGNAGDRANRDGAADLARLAFPLLPRAAQGTNRHVQRPTG